MSLRFTKMHGLGNDFLVLDTIRQTIHLTPKEIAALAKRDTGIGFDQCLIIEPSSKPNIDFFYRIFNADGTEVGQCGNGARCLALFVKHYDLTSKNTLTIATKTTEMGLTINDDKTVTVQMAKPKLAPKDIPLNAKNQAMLYTLPLSNHTSCDVHAIHVGNPHALLIVPDLMNAPVSSLGREISEHDFFSEGTNVGFMEMLGPAHIKLRVYERGAGETRACGSGAVAAVALGRLYHALEAEVKVSLLGGDLFIHWPTLDGPIFMKGPAAFVYEGQLL